MSDMTRKDVIENLEKLKAFLEINGVFTVSDAIKNSIDFAIASLETDEAYQLEYERTTKNDLGVSSGLKNVGSIIDWNNCHTPEQLDSIATTKNDLGVDWESYRDVDGNCLDDLILEVLQNNFDCGNTYGYKVADEIIGLLPSATPQEPKTGHWNEIPKYKDIAWRCSECEHFTTMKHNYCPNCGCRMVEPQKSEG